MQKYYTLNVQINEPQKEFLMAQLAELNFDTFLETEEGFEASIPELDLDQTELNELLAQYQIAKPQYELNLVEQQNWNATWESSFEPVCIGNKLRIRAPFHIADPSFEMELIIQPKTSFGTGHHETTEQILSLMLGTAMQNKQVFDFGSGTGILAILASKLGASSILANDIDDWAAENILENTALNEVSNVQFIHGDLAKIGEGKFDIILANINRNVLAASMKLLAEKLNKDGVLFISGFYESDLDYLQPFISQAQLIVLEKASKNNWCAAKLGLSF
jgi:ribosomal protein L11 methyltransferase